MESLRVVPENNRKRSLDVLITSLKEKEENQGKQERPRGDSDEDEDLVIELLSVEINDPEKSR